LQGLAQKTAALYPARMLSIFDEGPFAPCPAPFNLAAHVMKAGEAMPDKIALAILRLTGAERWSYARLTQAVRGTATGLLQSGLEPGQIVLMRLGNTVEFPIAYLGAITAGLVPVPTSSQLTEREVEGILAHLSPAAILRDAGVPCPTTNLPIHDTDALHRWRDLPPAAYDMGDPERLAYIVYTSGTSGKPRAVRHAHRAIWARQMMMQGWYGLGANDRLLHAGAFNWTYTLGTGLMDPWTMGATALIPAAGTEPAQLPLLLRRNDASIFAAAPGVYRQLLKAPLPALPKLRHGLAAGEKLPQTLQDAWAAATGTEIFEAFGMSECSTFISSAPGRPSESAFLGRPQTGRRIAILGEDGQPVPLDTPGTIAVHRSDPGLMLGYHDAADATADRFAGDWFLTGDQGQMQADGQIAYLGRDDDMMNAGGFRVSPLEVEAALADLPDLGDIAVTEVDVRPGVSVIAAFFTGSAEPATLESAAAERLARYKQPRLWQHMDALPRNPNGKLSRKALRAGWQAD
jgi:acyl-coenzyme A synthetase/AMP-(fatty) acid ligase